MEKLKSKTYRRDVIDNFFTYVDKDLLICKLFYFFFFAAFGSLYPLLAIYFKQLGMNATQSGILVGFRPFIEFCSAPFWGGVADRWRKWRFLQLMSVGSWVVFTLAMAFVKPPHVFCFGENNITETDIINYEKDLIKPAYSTVYYERGAVRDAFFALLLIVVIGEFFSAPAVTFADTVTLSYLGEDTDNYGRQRMFGSLGWGLSMFFVSIALDGSTTFPGHPCETQHKREKDYILCFAVFSVLMSCAAITAFQFKFAGQDESISCWPSPFVKAKNKVMELVFGQANIEKEKLVEDDDEFRFGQPKQTTIKNENQEPKLGENGKPLQISLEESKQDMVSDVVNSPGAAPAKPPPFDPDDPFLGRWTAVLKILAQLKFVSVLFVAWFMGFGVGLIFTFLFWHLQDLGGSPTLFGVASVINHTSELLAYFLCSRFIATFGHIKVLYMGLVGNIVRFIYISCLTSPWMVLPFELVQGLTHAAVWATTCSYVMQAIPLTLRSSAQGILQGLHHGLGRGCGAVFGGMLVYSYGSEITFRAYGITCIFVLIAFIGVGVYLRRQGVSMESHIPHETLEDQAMTFNPHGVPSGMARDLSSNKLKQLDAEPVKSYGSTLGSDLKSDEGTQPAEQPVEDFNPRADYGYEYNAKVEKVKAIDPRNADTRTEDSINHKRGRTEKQVDDTDGFGRQHKKRDDRQPLTSERDVTDNQPEVKSEIEPHHARTHEAPRRHSLEHSEPRTERRERRRRQSGDIEGLREREDYSGQSLTLIQGRRLCSNNCRTSRHVHNVDVIHVTRSMTIAKMTRMDNINDREIRNIVIK
ncbi:MFSD6-like protein [Mya arenaria]|uniref:MFSD6-like protein n=1 Tax=Mya arenaria TaxID=6604 RepID=A0ABY7EP00_MYAAR|nr:MFSD6-like protein [Mya arenaria]